MPFDHPDDALPPGYRLKQYEILRVLGRGGFGITYQARSNGRSGELFAIKELYPHRMATRNPDMSVTSAVGWDNLRPVVEMFVREKNLACRIRHPNIVEGREAFEFNNTGYLVMRYLTGRSLRQSLRDPGGFRPTPASLPRFAGMLIDAVQSLHDLNLIHCDIKTDNIFLGINFEPVLIDLGSARLNAPGHHGEIAETYSRNYSPVEFLVDDAGAVGPWSDVYQTAAVLYRCIAGGLATDGIERLDAVARSLADPFVPLIELPETTAIYPESLLRAIDQGMGLLPQDRPPDMRTWRGMMPGVPARRHHARQTSQPPPVPPPVPPQGPWPETEGPGHDEPTDPPAPPSQGLSGSQMVGILVVAIVFLIMLANTCS